MRHISALALTLCLGLTFTHAQDCVPYDRALYKHWVDSDKDGIKTRDEVLQEESLIPATIVSNKVTKGKWHDPYTNTDFTDPKKLDVDHLVPLSEAHASGGWAWDKNRRQGYANYLVLKNHLISVDLSANRAKGDKDPAEWLPGNVAYRKQYVKDWCDVKARWKMTADTAEVRAIKEVLGEKQSKIWLKYVKVAEEQKCD